MSPSHMQLTAASDEEMLHSPAPTPRPSRRRGLALAVTVVGLVCIVGASWPNTKRVTARQHFGKFRDAIVQAFDESVLADQPSMITKMEFQFGEEGAEEPSAMEIAAKIHIDDDPQEDFVFEHTFLAEEGKGDKLKAALDDVLEVIRKMPDGSDGLLNEDGEDMVSITQTEDDVVLRITMDQPPPQLAQGFEDKVEFDASFNFGRDLDSLYTNMEENAFVAWHGLHFKLDAKFKGLVAAALTHMLSGPEEDKLHWGLGFASFGGKLDIRYKTPDELGDLFDTAPTLEALFENLKDDLSDNLPPHLTPLLLAFRGNLNGWKSTELRGLPENFKITMTYDNFKPSKLLVKMIDEIQPEEEETE